jgi:type I site-specific restriction endonuclease
MPVAPEKRIDTTTDIPPVRERRYVYGGSTSRPPGPGPSRKNQRGVRRKVSTFSILLAIFGVGGASVLYISNLVAINRLSDEVNQLRKRYETVENANAFLRREINSKSTWEKISISAAEKLSMRPAQAPPVWFDVDWEKIHELEARQN